MIIEKIVAEVAYPIRTILGEGSLWDEKRQVLMWVDIMGCKVYCYDPKNRSNQGYDVGEHVGTVVLDDSGAIHIALVNGIAKLDPATGILTRGAAPEADKPGNRFNDGKCDPRGRFWAGTMAYDLTENEGALYCFNGKGNYETKLCNVSISNGLVWSRDETIFYFIDSLTYELHSYDYNPDTSEISNKKVVHKFSQDGGMPDGMAIDSEGHVWVALYWGHKVIRIDPAGGEIVYEIEVPAPNVTSCAFGGESLNDLYITTASSSMKEEIEKYPLSGSLFKANLPFTGVVGNRYKT
jgi:sugar lactone lactonase YvrE